MKESLIVNRFHATQEEIRESLISFLEYIADMPEKVLQRIAQVQMSKI
jgi:hypothetical protein